ncbi:hypothetical protein GCM10023078_38730 [Gibbsiella greigii]
MRLSPGCFRSLPVGLRIAMLKAVEGIEPLKNGIGTEPCLVCKDVVVRLRAGYGVKGKALSRRQKKRL